VKISSEVKTGIVVTVAIAASIWGFNYLKGTDIFTTNKTCYAIYNNIDGLAASNRVIMNGYVVGLVKKIRFADDRSGRMIVTMQLKRDIFIPDNSIAQIVSSDFFGGKAIEIIMGDSPEPLAQNDTLKSDLKSGIEQQLGPIKDKTERLIVSLDSLSRSLNNLLDEKNRKNLSASIENFSQLTAHLERSAASLDRMISSPDGKLNRIVSNTEAVSATLKDNQKKIGEIISQTEQLTDSLSNAPIASSISHLNSSLAELNAILKKINQGEGSAGMLVNDRELYMKLTSAADQLDKLLADLKANPKRYVHFSLFGKKQK
jgi:phospholipid/cholesterol/gamma-HCH transport system substrate-binding protein